MVLMVFVRFMYSTVCALLRLSLDIDSGCVCNFMLWYRKPTCKVRFAIRSVSILPILRAGSNINTAIHRLIRKDCDPCHMMATTPPVIASAKTSAFAIS